MKVVGMSMWVNDFAVDVQSRVSQKGSQPRLLAGTLDNYYASLNAFIDDPLPHLEEYGQRVLSGEIAKEYFYNQGELMLRSASGDHEAGLELAFQYLGGGVAGTVKKAGGVAKGGFTVDSSMFAADEAAGVLSNGKYIKNPTAQNLSDLVTGSGRIGGKNMNGQYMYAIDQDGSIIIGSRGGQRMPHPTLIGGENPQVLGAGIVDIRSGRIYSVDNASGHFKPGAGSLDAARDAFGNLPSSVIHKNFQGYLPYKPGGN